MHVGLSTVIWLVLSLLLSLSFCSPTSCHVTSHHDMSLVFSVSSSSIVIVMIKREKKKTISVPQFLLLSSSDKWQLKVKKNDLSKKSHFWRRNRWKRWMWKFALPSNADALKHCDSILTQDEYKFNSTLRTPNIWGPKYIYLKKKKNKKK